MRVLHVLPSVSRAYGGPTQSLLGYALASRKVGVDFDIVAPRPDPDDIAWWRSRLPGHELKLFSARGDGAFVTSPALSWWLWQHGQAYDVVHIHALQNPVSSSAAAICARKRWPFVIRPLGMLSAFTFNHRRVRAKRIFFAAVDRPNLRHASGLHFTTTGERDEGLRRVGDLGLATYVIPPPWTGTPPIGTRSDRPRLLFLSRLHPVKNLESLLSCWPEVLKRVPDAEFVLAGNGDPGYVKQLTALASSLGIMKSTTFVGFVDGDKKRELLASAHAFALPSQHENFGVAVLEAMAAGLPSVLSPEVHLAPLIVEHRLGMVVKGTDTNALADSIATCFKDSELQRHCASEGPKIAAQRFSLETVGGKLLAMYQAIRSRVAYAAPVDG